jgi:hypothetical protein
MLEWLAATASVELGKLVLDQVLNLGKSALEDYVKDFFKDCIKGGITRANAETLKKPMAEAIGFFIKRFVKELQINDVPETSIDHHYKAAIKRFVQDKSVRPILGKAFETHCKQIDYAQLQQIWTQHYQESEWQFPAEEFDWRGVAKEYAFEVKGIIKANAELRSLLEAELLETIAQNTQNLNTQISPGFDIAKYRESLQFSYGYLKLYTLDSTDRTDAIRLWNIFIEQTVREALPPTRYELPLDLKRQLQEQGQLEADLSSEALERYRQDYFQQPARKVLEAVAESQWAVILGDPGAGKSTLLQYLALGWVEGKADALPLLIELREYAISLVNNFLEFLHRGRGVDWQFDQQQLHQYLQENRALIMFDGLDEVFDRATQAAIVDYIIRFAQIYPKAQIVITSRIIGYNPERLRHAGFQHFTIQPLNTDEIHEFIDRWYTLVLGNDPDKSRLVTRLKNAIANSKAIQNLADNPLLLTMMAILNRRQELPRDRADLYDQASRVLLYHWDVDHKRLQLPMDAIGRREKQEILRAIAYEMQAGERGLQGNVISAERLTQILTDNLGSQGFSQPREKANLLIQQLRERNFILCYQGADSYGFVHRTFLEYFCAVEIVNRFEKQRTLTVEQLREKIFGQRWQDEAWHEVLKLICSMIDSKFVLELVDYLSDLDSKNSFNLLLAAQCFSEIGNQSEAFSIYLKLLNTIFSRRQTFSWTTGQDSDEPLPVTPIFRSNISKALLTILEFWKDEDQTLAWIEKNLHICLEFDEFESGDAAAVIVQKLANIKFSDPNITTFLKICVESSRNYIVRSTALCELIKRQNNDAGMMSTLEQYALHNEEHFVRWIALYEMARIWRRDTKVFEILCYCAIHDPFYPDQRTHRRKFYNPRAAAVHKLAQFYPECFETLIVLKDRAKHDPDWMVRYYSIEDLSKIWENSSEKFEFLCDCVLQDHFERNASFEDNPRKAALTALLNHYFNHPRTTELLHDKAASDSDKQLREWARQRLEQI